jgi:hypothetical protein
MNITNENVKITFYLELKTINHDIYELFCGY